MAAINPETKEHVLQLIKYIDDYFQGERKKKVKELIKEYYHRIVSAPASSKRQYHCCFEGGWLVHTLNVIDNALKLSKLWQEEGYTADWTDEEIVFAAMFHDFGKLGDENGKMYIPEKNNWKRNHGTMYAYNPRIDYMKVPDRSLFILQYYGIGVSRNEYFGIKLSDGLFDSDTQTYYHNFENGPAVKGNLHVIIHHADHMSTIIEEQVFNK